MRLQRSVAGQYGMIKLAVLLLHLTHLGTYSQQFYDPATGYPVYQVYHQPQYYYIPVQETREQRATGEAALSPLVLPMTQVRQQPPPPQAQPIFERPPPVAQQSSGVPPISTWQNTEQQIAPSPVVVTRAIASATPPVVLAPAEALNDVNEPNNVFMRCCKSKNVHKSCESRCNFDNINKKILTQLFLGVDQCPQSYGLALFSCAGSHADHTECCLQRNVQRTKAGNKVPFLTLDFHPVIVVTITLCSCLFLLCLF